ncbi:MAG: glycoside hydrolase family 57 protein [Bacteroidales bacterium]|nr:glycoside hydrolase family 57 protein [Bacteroidales bacterium]
MKKICLYFQLHQPVRLRRYRFFDIGNDHYYYDDYANESNINKLAHTCYLPTNKVLTDLLKQFKGKFSVAFSISGTLIDQFKVYAPEVIDSFKTMAKTGGVEFLAETYASSLASVRDVEEFKRQVAAHVKTIEDTFGQTPTAFRNTQLIYSDQIGEAVSAMGFKVMLAEGAKQTLGWKSPDYLYCNAIDPHLKVLARNYHLSDDIALRFSNQGWGEWPLTAQKFKGWLDGLDNAEEVINLFMDYETFGAVHSAETGIIEFLKALPAVLLEDKNYAFTTPSQAAQKLQPKSAINVPTPTSWVDEERDLTAWLGNEMQQEAVDKLYALTPLVAQCNDQTILKDWEYLQATENFYFMGTKFFANGASHTYQSPYPTPYEAFINYMNILSDFAERLRHAVPTTENNEVTTLKAENDLLQNEISSLKKQLVKAGVEPAAAKKAPARRKAAAASDDTAAAEKKPAKRSCRKKSDPKE